MGGVDGAVEYLFGSMTVPPRTFCKYERHRGMPLLDLSDCLLYSEE